MTPEDLDPDRSEENPGPEDEETVRRLLAGAAGPLTMPEDVAGRLDAVLAGLLAERDPSSSGASEADRSATVTDLPGRRARRWPKVLVAAAAVSVIGVGLGNIVRDGSGDSMSASTSEEAPSTGAGEAAEGAQVAPLPGSGDGPGEDRRRRESAQVLGATAPTSALPRVRAGSVTLDAQRIHDLSLRGPAGPPRAADGADAAARACDLPAVTRGEALVAVRLDGERATLRFRAEEDGKRPVEVYSCDDGDSPVLLTTVDVR